MPKEIAIGDKIPSFELPDHNSNPVSISPNDNQNRIIYFYPKDDTRICTEQACSFRDWYDVFLENGFEVIGISSDSPESHRKFKARHKLNFILLSDASAKVRKLFGATKFFDLVPERKTFLINKEGIVTFIYNSLFEGEKHATKLLQQVKTISRK